VKPTPDCYALTVETCLFCSACVKEGHRRFEQRDILRDFVMNHFHPSPFVYTKIVDNRLRQFEPLCGSCSGLMGRAERRGPRDVKKRTGIPIDRFLTFLVNPGVVHMLDRRCLEKISESLSAPTLGLVWQELPLMAGVMVEEVRRSLLEKSPHSMKNLMVLAWCKYN
jgi:hypothetical protein